MIRKAAHLITLLALLSALVACGTAESSPTLAFGDTPLVDPNTAAESELRNVPGLNDVAISAIISGRPFATPTELHAAIGLDFNESDQSLVYGALFIKVGLNTGAEDDYKLIPSSMSARKLAHEFEEYRPYESIDQFRREMAKYVSDEEVKHLVRYVTLD